MSVDSPALRALSVSDPQGFCLVQGLQPLPHGFARAVVALGNFDGLHRGHRAVIGEAQRLAASLGLPAGLLSFEPHPRSFFKPDAPLFRLTPAPLKAALACGMGLQGLIELPFNHALAGTSAHDFIEEMLIGQLGIGGIVIGHDFHFGKGRQGSPEMIAEMGARLGIPVSVVAALKEGEEPVSSSQIRECLVQGDVAAAAHLLGYRWLVRGEVVHGDKRGRLLGFPTANMVPGKDCALKYGIYAVRMAVDGVVHDGVASFGRRPTFDDGAPRLETFVFDFDGDLYGKTVDVEFCGFLRGEAKFDSVEALIVQMDADCARARAMLADQSEALSVLDDLCRY